MGNDMKLMLTPGFSPGFTEPGKPDAYAKGIDHSLYSSGVVPDCVLVDPPFVVKADKIAKVISDVQPIESRTFTKALKALDEAESAIQVTCEHEGSWSNGNEVEKRHLIAMMEGASSEILAKTKPDAVIDGPAATQGKPSLMKVYMDGMWPPYQSVHVGSPITSISDVEVVFEDLVKATRYFIETTMGLSAKSADACASSSIVALHLMKQIIRTINECVLPAVAVQTKLMMSPFDVDLLAEAVKRRACYETDWNLPWEEFVDKLHGIVVKCDEENNPPEDVEQGKVNVDVVVPQHTAEHINLNFVIGPEGADPAETTPQEPGDAFKDLCDWAMAEGKDNQPVPCSPPRPSKPLAVTKVPVTDEHGKDVDSPGEGWWLGVDLCWHPPLTKEQEKHALDLITALQPAALGQLPDPAEVKFFIAPYQPLYTTPPIIPVDLQKKFGVSIGGHGTIGPGGEVEDHKVTGAWPVMSANSITKSAPCAPTSIDDVSLGFKVGDVWYNSSNGVLYRCTSCALGVATWYAIGNVTPTPEGPKIILLSKPKHIAYLDPKMLDGPVTATYVDTSDQPDLPRQKDLVQALTEQVAADLKAEAEQYMVGAFNVPLGHANKNGDVYGKSPILGHVAAVKAAMSDQEYMHAKMMEAMKIPKHLLVSKVHNSR